MQTLLSNKYNYFIFEVSILIILLTFEISFEER